MATQYYLNFNNMDLQTRICLVQCYYECGKNYTAGFRMILGWKAEYYQMKACRNLIGKFENKGFVNTQNCLMWPKDNCSARFSW